MGLRSVPTAARAAAVGRGVLSGLALRAEPLWACSMGLILAGGAVTVYVVMVGGASLKCTTRARGGGAVVSGGCGCDAPSIASGVVVVGRGRCSVFPIEVEGWVVGWAGASVRGCVRVSACVRVSVGGVVCGGEKRLGGPSRVVEGGAG